MVRETFVCITEQQSDNLLLLLLVTTLSSSFTSILPRGERGLDQSPSCGGSSSRAGDAPRGLPSQRGRLLPLPRTSAAGGEVQGRGSTGRRVPPPGARSELRVCRPGLGSALLREA